MKHLLTLHLTANSGNQGIMIDFIEKLRQVHIHNPTFPAMLVLLCLQHCLMGIPPRPETIAVIGKRRLKQWAENLVHCLLNQTVKNRWNTQKPCSSIRFGDFNPENRLRTVGPVQQLLFDKIPVAVQISLDVR